MVSSLHRKLMLLLLVALLAAKLNMVCSVKRMDTVVQTSREDEHTRIKNQDLKAEVAKKEMKSSTKVADQYKD
ncbi:hypothetical protein V2J09_012990 [Rumex salicifolius]